MTVRSAAVRFRVACVAVGVIVAAFLFAYPTQSLIAQQRQVNDARKDLDALVKENHDLRVEAKRLQTPAEIERVARERYNMVRENEHAYAIVPQPRRKPTPTPTTAP